MQRGIINRSVLYYLIFVPGVLLLVNAQAPLWAILALLTGVSTAIVMGDVAILCKCDWEKISQQAIRDAIEEQLKTPLLEEI